MLNISPNQSELMRSKFNEAFPRDGRISDADIAAACSVTPQAVSGWRKTGRVSKGHLSTLAELSGKAFGWWLGSDLKGTLRETVAQHAPDPDSVQIPILNARDDASPSDPVEVPFYPGVSAAAGAGSINEQDGQYRAPLTLSFRAASLRKKGLHPENCAVIYARGDSMEPTVSCGDAIMLDRTRTSIQDGQLYVIRIDDTEAVKRLHTRPGGRVLVSSENPAYPPYEVQLGSPGFAVLGQVMWRSGWV